MNNSRSRAVEIIDVELICVYEDKAADIMLKVVACARILMYNTFRLEVYIYATIKMAFRNRPILQNLFGQATCPLWNQQQSIYVLNQNLSFARHFTGFFNGYVLCSSEQYCTDSCGIRKAGNDYAFPNDKDKRTCKLYPTERALSVIDEVQTVCEKTEALLLQGMSESEQNLFMDFLIQAGRNITSELHIERKGEEFND